MRRLLFATTALVPLGLATAFANPLGGQVVDGNANIGGTGTSNVVINQSSQNVVINWNSFNIGSGEKTQFIQPNLSSSVLNRVTGDINASQILGTLSANGRVYLINPNGILIGQGAVINTGSFLATTHDISNADFMAGRYNFNIPGRPDASIVNLGTITASNSGFAALVAPGVRNSGTITARFGSVGLASANGFSLDLYGDKLIQLNVNDSIAGNVRDVETGQTLRSLVTNDGKLKANGGTVQLTAVAARQVVDSVINTSGVIEARSIGRHAGKIVLGGPTSGTKIAGLPTQTVKVSGKLNVASKKSKGGTIQITGENIEVTDARLDASGRTGGGRVLIGGDIGGGKGNPLVTASLEFYSISNATTVSVNGNTVIDASARSTGNGGKVVVWADQATSFMGTIYARGGEVWGNGGFVEVSGKSTLAFGGTVDTRAPNGSYGTLLLDPGNLTIQVGGGSSFTGSDTANSTLDVAILTAALGLNNVIVQTGHAPGFNVGDIIVSTQILWGAATTLTLSAYRNIAINANIANTGGASVILRTDSTGTGFGTVSFGGGTVSTSGTVSIYYDPTGTFKYQSPTNFSGNVTGGATLTSYMLINNAGDLTLMQGPNGNLGGTYALGRDIDATSFVAGGPGTTLTGLFDGNGGLGVNYTISNVTINSSGSPIGLFGFIGTNATVRNLNLANFNVTGNTNTTFIGTLAGENDGTINNVHVLSGTVNGGNHSGIGAGGLVGQNRGTISNSSAAVNVTVGDSVGLFSINFVGGLVGGNLGTITSSSASGNVTAGINGEAGGLVGSNGGDFFGGGVGLIQSSFATGEVHGGFNAGGLVGFNSSAGTILDSYATGNVIGTGGITGNCFGDNCQSVSAGGLVGVNQGFIASQFSPSGTYATGNVSVGSGGAAGGFVGFNSGLILNAYATGFVTGAAGTFAPEKDVFGQATILGGFVGTNQGLIGLSYSTGNVGGTIDRLLIGGFVGDNSGEITGAYSTGNVRAGNFSQAGGFAGTNSSSECFNCGGQGVFFSNEATIDTSHSSGNVVVGANSIAGGFAGSAGNITFSSSTGSVTGGEKSILGGFVGFTDPDSFIAYSTASGSVTSTGPNSWVGGFLGLSAGVVWNSSATGNVSVTSDTIAGGFVGVNLGWIDPSSSKGSVNGSGGGNVLGGFAGANFGFIDQALATGPVTGAGPNNVIGGLIGANSQFINFQQGILPFSSFPVGTFKDFIGSPGLPLVGVNFPSTLPGYPPLITSCDAGICQVFRDGILGGRSSQSDIPQSVQSPPVVVIPTPPPDNTKPLPILILLPGGGGGSVNTAPSGPPGYPNSQPGRPGFTPPPLPMRLGPDGPVPSGLPPLNETRFLSNQVVMRLGGVTLTPALIELLQRLGIRVVSNEPLPALGGSLVRLALPPGMTVRRALTLLEANRFVPQVSPEYQFRLTQADASISKGDPAQYTIGKFELEKTHKIATGKGVTVGVIDSEVDKAHTEFKGGAITNEFDTLAVKEPPHSHGTAMAGAIGSRDRLLGIAPGARIIAVRAFGESNNTAEGTTTSIIKGLEWALKEGAKVVNMSFAGPRDPALERALKAAYDKGLIMVAAAGNAGPKSPPLYPGADPHVIAVTATDVKDRGFRGANQGPQLSVAAPGVEVLAPAPEENYQMSTGTSIATAHVTGVVALMLERDPRLTPSEVRRILEETATDLGPRGKDAQYGWGLVNPQKALQAVEARLKSSDASKAKP